MCRSSRFGVRFGKWVGVRGLVATGVLAALLIGLPGCGDRTSGQLPEVSGEAIQCNCGRTGCWELIASKKALLKYYSEATGCRAASLEEVFDETRLETPAVQEALEKYIDGLFIGIENIILGLNPEYVIIGGELGRYGKPLLDLMNRSNHMKSNFVEYEGSKVVFSELGDQGSLIGAALLPFEELFNGRRGIIS